MTRIFFLSGFIWGVLAQAAPYPATSTSALTSPELGHYFQSKGFSLKTEGTEWLPRPSDATLNSVRFTPKNPQEKGSLSVRIDSVTKNGNLELFSRKWMRDYPSYGFEVLSAKNILLNGQDALVVDMFSRSKNKQLRQVVLKKDSKVAVLTCLDERTSFAQSLQKCNRIMQSFTWVAP